MLDSGAPKITTALETKTSMHWCFETIKSYFKVNNIGIMKKKTRFQPQIIFIVVLPFRVYIT
jgi:hypothetical protein